MISFIFHSKVAYKVLNIKLGDPWWKKVTDQFCAADNLAAAYMRI